MMEPDSHYEELIARLNRIVSAWERIGPSLDIEYGSLLNWETITDRSIKDLKALKDAIENRDT